MELVKISGAEYGISETKAQEIAAQFKPMLDKMVELEAEANKVFAMKKGTIESEEQAKIVRLKLVKVRTGTEQIHKAQKAFYLAGGRFVDGWKNAQLFASQGLEEKLWEVERYAKNKEAERVEKLNQKRGKEISAFVDPATVEHLNFGAMSEEVWAAYLDKKKKDFEDQKEAERVAEQARQIKLVNEQIAKARLKVLIPLASYLDTELEFLNLEEMEDGEYLKIEEEARAKKAENDAALELARQENQRIREEAEEREMRRKVVSGMYNEFDGERYSYNGRLAKTAEEIFAIPKDGFQKFVNELLVGVTEIKDQEAAVEAERQKRYKVILPLHAFLREPVEKLLASAEADFKAAVESAAKDKEIHDRETEEAREAEIRAEIERSAKLRKEQKEKEIAERLAKAGDQERMAAWIDSMLINDLNQEGFSPEAKKVANVIFEKFLSFKVWAIKEIEKI